MAIENLQKHLLLALLICSFLFVVLKNVNEKENKKISPTVLYDW